MNFEAKQELIRSRVILSTYRIRQIILITLDFIMIALSNFISIETMLKDYLPYNNQYTIVYGVAIVYSLIGLCSICYFNGYSSLWRYAEIDEVIIIAKACIINTILLIGVVLFMKLSIPIYFYYINYIMNVAVICAIRIGYRYVRQFKLRKMTSSNVSRVLIIGGGSGGSIVINELYDNPQLNKVPVAVVDDDVNKIGRLMHGVPILDTTHEIESIVEKMKIDEIIFSIASANNEAKQKILKRCNQTNCKVKTIPGIYEIIDGKVDIKKIRDVEIKDLLGRKPIEVDINKISNYITDKVVLVTGGGGSIGSELCRQIASNNPKMLVLVDIYENNAYEIEQELLRTYKENINLKTIIASIRDKNRMDKVFEQYKPDVVFHAAAHKHVPLMEVSPGEAIKNNIFGTKNIAELAHKYEVSRFVLISTDKAVNPTNIMGATKRATEMIIQTMNESSKTEFVAVRFGNVLGSNGSVIPLFKKQIEEGGPITVTHPEIIRYFMTIPEAVQLVIQAGAMAKGGEIFILDMGQPVKILDLATNLIKLSGLEPGVDIKINYSGLRPGEKLYEELLMAEEGILETYHEKIFIGKPIDLDKESLNLKLNKLKEIIKNEETDLIEPLMKEIVPTYKKEVMMNV